MKKPQIKCVVFDLGGVIMSGGYLPFIKKFCMECLTPEGHKKIADLEHQVNLGKITERQFYVQIEKVFHVHLSPEKMHKLITKKMQVNKSLLKFIPELKPAKIALFTNSIGHMAVNVLHERHFPVRKTFNRLFLSNRLHVAKPDAKAYQYVIKKMGVKPKEILMVDDRKENIDAAKAVGMQGIIFKNTTQFKKAMKDFQLQ